MAGRFVSTVQSEYRSARITLVAHRRVAEYWRCWPGCDVVTYDPSGGRIRALVTTAARLRREGPYDAGYLLTPSLSSALLFVLAGIGRRIGFAGDTRGWLLSDPYTSKFGRSQEHLSKQYLALLAGMDAGSESEVAELNWPDSDALTMDDRLRQEGVDRRGFVVAAVGTEGEAKRYPAHAWIGALRLVTAKATVICVGSERERGLTAEIAAAAGSRVIDWSGTTSLGELAVLLKRASIFVGADSGAAHLAASLGTPTVAIFGPGNPTEVCPQGAEVTILREPLWCSPCGRARCPRRDHPKECLDLLSPSALAQTVLERLSQGGVR